ASCPAPPDGDRGPDPPMTTVYLAGIGETFQSTAISGPLLLAMLATLAAGVVSFASPCVIPLVPGYLSYLAGVVGAEGPALTEEEAAAGRGRGRDRWRVAGAAGLFVAGFTVVFVLLTAMVFGAISALTLNRDLLERIGGAVTI